MGFLLLSFFAGALTVLAPCILPLLPVVIGSSVARSRLTPYIVIASLAVSIFVFTFLLKVSTAFISIPPSAWSYLSGAILIVAGMLILFPKIWSGLNLINKANQNAHQSLGQGYQKKSFWGDIIIGTSLGPIFSTCSPTYFVILGTVLPASLWQGTVYLLAYILGLVLVLLLITHFGQRFTNKLDLKAGEKVKRIIGALIIVVGIFIISGYDKKVQTWVLDNGIFDISRFEQKLLDGLSDKEESNLPYSSDIEVPRHLLSNFPKTDFSRIDPLIKNALSGGPGKDGIPALTNPKMEPIKNFKRSGDIQAIVLLSETETKVYPYNILTWHEIVNDTIDGTPVSVTFCPLCGSAIVFNRKLNNGEVLELGVSGSLLESNMIMYDRTTESLWQQSTGHTLAGSYHPNQLGLHPFQLMTVVEAGRLYPEALVLSEQTGYSRNYNRNPYAGYETNEQFYFSPSSLDDKFPAKEIMVVFRVEDKTVAIPWLALRAKSNFEAEVGDRTFNFSVTPAGELSIKSQEQIFPFYYEMWFSFAVQHGENAIVINVD
jgi:cytochrome c biogenesis protein CcdA